MSQASTTARMLCVDVVPEDICVLSTLGQGSFGTVHLVEFNGGEAAAKVIPSTKDTIKMIEREVQILKQVQHPNVVACLGICDQGRYCYILQEFCAGGPLFELLHNSDDISISWQQQWQFLQDCACAMEYLHANGIIHRDLKSLNCLLASPVLTPADQVSLKVADFGMGKTKEKAQDWGNMTIAAGTCHWMAPEVVEGHTYSEPVDVYSYSMLMFEIICREIPFEEEEPAAVGLIVCSGGRPDLDALPPRCPPDLSALVVACWDGEAAKRPNFAQIRSTLESLRDELFAFPLPDFVAMVGDSAEGRDGSTHLPQPCLPEDLLPSFEPDQEPQEFSSDLLRVEVRCERSRVSAKRQALLGLVTLISPERLTELDRDLGPLVAIRQPSEEPEPTAFTKKRLALDLILVLDVSGSMSGKKLQLLKQAAGFVVRELGSEDRLAIVSFSTTAHEHLNFCRMDENGRARAEGVLEALRADSQTSIAAGLRLGIGLADARQSRNSVSGLLLLTDGQNNCGTVPLALVSDAREKGLSIYAFGIGEDHDAALLGRIAEHAKTPIAYIEKPEALVGAFAAIVGGLLSVRARNIELCISCIGCTELKAVHSPFLDHLTGSYARLMLPDLFSGERRDIVLDLDAPSGNELIEVSVRFHDGRGLASIPSCRLQISRGEPESEPDDEVTAQRERLAVATLLQEALREGRARHVIKARKILEQALQRPWRPEHRSELEESLARLGKEAVGVSGAGFASLADVAQMHSFQRSLFSSPGLGGSNGTYLTNGQLRAIARST